MLLCVIDKPLCSFEKNGLCSREEHCEPCISECLGCNKVLPGLGTHYCVSYPVPETMWRLGVCALSSHTNVDAETKLTINPIKLARRSRMGG